MIPNKLVILTNIFFFRKHSIILEKKKESRFSFTKLFKTANQTVIDGYKCVMKKRPHRHILLFSIFLMIFTGMGFNQNTQLYVEKNFGWNLPEYTNYMRFAIVICFISIVEFMSTYFTYIKSICSFTA